MLGQQVDPARRNPYVPVGCLHLPLIRQLPPFSVIVSKTREQKKFLKIEKVLVKP